jgi:hypothetical protein
MLEARGLYMRGLVDLEKQVVDMCFHLPHC